MVKSSNQDCPKVSMPSLGKFFHTEIIKPQKHLFEEAKPMLNL
jgi:hypothetical protein